MSALGVPVGTFADGSGLSSLDRQTPSGEVALLRAAARTTVASGFKSSLARACVDGTLANRMCGTAAAGRVWAKTGTLDYVRVLSGYTSTRSGRTVWFSFMLSGCDNGLSCRNAIDRAVAAIAGFTG
jgi:D-alanyl-D-alanine carboxypeptidase/D-alanyl-D-alanine-endopeptidase (penicillin-binding protein 4)